MLFSREKAEFTFPVHIHQEYELNFIENGAGSKRMVGDSMEEIGDLELTLITGSNLEHGWLQHKCRSKKIKEITIQFHSDLVNESLLQKNQFHSMKEMFAKATFGVTFSEEMIRRIKDRLYSLASEHEGAHSVFKLFGILYDLSLSDSMRTLSSWSFRESERNYDSRRIENVYKYMADHYRMEITLSDMARIAGMSEVAFSRFFKKRTSRTFVECLTDIRLGHATRMLVDTTHGVSEISYLCGFNNLSNFNRIFKKKKGCTPTEFRTNFNESKIFL